MSKLSKRPVFPEFTEDWSLLRQVSVKPQGIVWLAERKTRTAWAQGTVQTLPDAVQQHCEQSELEPNAPRYPICSPETSPLLAPCASSGRQWGYFKYAGREHRYYAGPMLANEWLAAMILRRLGLPAARVIPARVDGLEGIVSVAPRADWIRQWRELPRSLRVQHWKRLYRPSGLYGMLVFDIWTTNIDRGRGKNLIVYRRQGEKKYRYLLIDHALALHGSYYKWDRYGHWPGPSWQKPWRVYEAPEGLRPTLRRLKPWVRRIQALPVAWLRRLIWSIPSRHLSTREARFIYRLLTVRQRQLDVLIRRWLEYRRRHIRDRRSHRRRRGRRG